MGTENERFDLLFAGRLINWGQLMSKDGFVAQVGRYYKIGYFLGRFMANDTLADLETAVRLDIDARKAVVNNGTHTVRDAAKTYGFAAARHELGLVSARELKTFRDDFEREVDKFVARKKR